MAASFIVCLAAKTSAQDPPLVAGRPPQKPPLQIVESEAFTLWPEANLNFAQEPRLNGSGTRLAVRGRFAIEVYAVERNGQLGAKLWSSENLKYRYDHFFAWWGDQLLLSRSGDEPQRPIADYTIRGLERYKPDKAPGSTFVVDPLTGKMMTLLAAAYRSLAVDSTGRYLAAASPSHKPFTDTPVEIYQLDQTKKSARLLGKFSVQRWFEKSLGRPLSLVWSPDSSGVYVAGYNEDTSNGFKAKAPLYFVSRDGKGRMPPLKKNLDLLTGPGRTQMLALAPSENGVWWLANYFLQAWSQVLITPEGVKREVPLRDAQAPLGPLARNSGRRELNMLAMTPNRRFTLFQDTRDTKDVDDPELGIVWAVDSITKKRRQVVLLPPVTESVRWSGDALLVSLLMGRRTNKSPACFGLLHFPEGNMPAADPKLEAIVAREPWEDARPGVPPVPEIRAAAEFLRRPMMAPVSLSSAWNVPSGLNEAEKKLTVYALGENGDDVPRIAVDRKSQRVLEFVAPAPSAPQPDIPVAIEKAQAAAESLARLQKPDWWDAGSKVLVAAEPKVTPRAAYVVRFQRAASTTRPEEWLDVEVRAGDGKISGYLEFSAAPRDMSRGFLHPSERNPAPDDSAPRWSSDGRKIAFLSTRARLGYPSWWPGRPRGLYVADSDGRGVQNIAPEAASAGIWSPDGRYIAYSEKPAPFFGDTVRVYDFATKSALSLPGPTADESINVYVRGWLAPHRLLLIWLHSGPGGSDLMEWDPEQPTRAPKLMVRDFNKPVGNEGGAGAFALSRDNNTLFFTWTIPDQFSIGSNCAYALYSVPTNNVAARPSKLADCLPVGESLLITTKGIVINGRGGVILVDANNGKVQPWQLPEALLAKTYVQNFSDVQPSPDFSRLAVPLWTKAENLDKVRVLHIVGTDGALTEPVPVH